MLFLYLYAKIWYHTSMKSITGYTCKEALMKDKFVGIAKVGEKGQIVIPKEARDMFDIKPGDIVAILCDKKKGMAIAKSKVLEDAMDKVMPGK